MDFVVDVLVLFLSKKVIVSLKMKSLTVLLFDIIGRKNFLRDTTKLKKEILPKNSMKSSIRRCASGAGDRVPETAKLRRRDAVRWPTIFRKAESSRLT